MPYIERVIPVLSVSSLKRSLDFYRDILGFELEWGGESGDTICSVVRDRQSIMLSEGEADFSKACVWLGLEDDSLFGILKEKNVKIILEPRNMPWAYEMKIEDPDGNILWLGTESKTDAPSS